MLFFYFFLNFVLFCIRASHRRGSSRYIFASAVENFSRTLHAPLSLTLAIICPVYAYRAIINNSLWATCGPETRVPGKFLPRENSFFAILFFYSQFYKKKKTHFVYIVNGRLTRQVNYRAKQRERGWYIDAGFVSLSLSRDYICAREYWE